MEAIKVVSLQAVTQITFTKLSWNATTVPLRTAEQALVWALLSQGFPDATRGTTVITA